MIAPTGDLNAEPAQDVPALLAQCNQRVLEREGIAMFIALHDARPGHGQPAAEPSTIAEGERLAQLFDHYEAGLAGTAPTRDPGDDPTGASALIDVLVVLSDQHLRATEEQA